MVKVLFVCMGNICRSPMAEAVFQDMVNKAGLSKEITVDSAGTGGWHTGERAHAGTLKILELNNIDYRGRARQIIREDLDDFDYVLAMDEENLAFIQRYARGSTAQIRLFLSFANDAGTVDEREVPDPYYDGTFDRVYSLVVRGGLALLDHIRKEHNL